MRGEPRRRGGGAGSSVRGGVQEGRPARRRALGPRPAAPSPCPFPPPSGAATSAPTARPGRSPRPALPAKGPPPSRAPDRCSGWLAPAPAARGRRSARPGPHRPGDAAAAVTLARPFRWGPRPRLSHDPERRRALTREARMPGRGRSLRGDAGALPAGAGPLGRATREKKEAGGRSKSLKGPRARAKGGAGLRGANAASSARPLEGWRCSGQPPRQGVRTGTARRARMGTGWRRVPPALRRGLRPCCRQRASAARLCFPGPRAAQGAVSGAPFQACFPPARWSHETEAGAPRLGHLLLTQPGTPSAR